jgi:uncharacterized protein
MLKDFTSLNPPAAQAFDGAFLHVETGLETDFWRETFYGFWRDNGHFLHKPVSGDFTAEVTIDGQYEALYDQAGLMIRSSETHWIKAGIEFTDGEAYLSTVVTNNASDWSLLPVLSVEGGLRIRLTRHGEAIRIQYRDGVMQNWKSARLAYFAPSPSVDIGIMCCSPQRAGFKVAFRDFFLGPPIARELHD